MIGQLKNAIKASNEYFLGLLIFDEHDFLPVDDLCNKTADCSGRGTCEIGRCTCEEGYAGLLL